MRLNSLTIHEAHEGLKRGDFTAVDLTRACYETIHAKEKELNAFVTLTEDAAYEAAEKVDKKIKSKKKIKLLEGVPLGVKDNILVQGVKASAGSKMLSTYVATYNATAVEKLKKQGAVILGKTNMDEFAMGSSGESSFFGPTKNPVDPARVPGGSSSGSTVAVAADEAIYALGSDTGGSVRQPASLCGIVGFKPTYGRVSRYGLMAMASSFDQIGTLTKNVTDAASVFDVMIGQDKMDATTAQKKADILKNLKPDLRGLRFGVPREYFIKGMDEEVEKVVRQAIEKIKSAGGQIIDISLPRAKYALAAYYILMPAEVSSNLARYDGVRYGHRATAGNLVEMYTKTRRAGFGDEVRRRIMLGTYVLSAGYYDAYYRKAQQARRLIKEDFDAAFKTVDVIVSPTSPTTAFRLGEKFGDPLTMYLADVFTVSANVAGLPAISIPAGSANGLPVGVQFMARHFDEQTLFNAAAGAEQILA